MMISEFTIRIETDDTTFEKTVESEDDLQEAREMLRVLQGDDVDLLPASSGQDDESGAVVRQLEALADLVGEVRDQVEDLEDRLDEIETGGVNADTGGSQSETDAGNAGSEDEEFDPFKENGLNSLERNEDGYYELDDVKDLSREAQHELVMETIREEQPIGIIGITKELFGSEKDSSSKEYGHVGNLVLNLRSQLEKEKKGNRSFYTIPGSDADSEDEAEEGSEDESEDGEVSIDPGEILDSSDEPEVDQRWIELPDGEETEAGKGKV